MSEYVDPWAGFALDGPDGWEVRTTRGIVSVRKDPNGFVSALLWPIRLPAPASTNDVAREFLAWARANNPSFSAWRVPGDGPFVLHTRAQREGKNLVGRFSVSVRDCSGLIAGFQCLEGALANAGPILARILESFHPVEPMARRQFREPAEGAFTVQIPPEWLVQGGVRRLPPYGVGLPWFQAASDGAGTRRVGMPWICFNFMEGAGWFLEMSVPAVQPLAYQPAVVLAERWLPQKFAEGRADFRVERVLDRSDLIPFIALAAAKAGVAPESVEMSAATLEVSYDETGRRFRERARILVQRPRSMGMMWTAQIDSMFRAPVEEFDRLEPVLSGILESAANDPAWEQAELARSQSLSMAMQQDALRRTREISRTLSETSDIITSGYWGRQAVYDDLSHKWSNAILGRQEVADPSTGRLYDVPHDHAQYWRDVQGNFYGTGWLFNPDPTWQKLEPTGR